MNSSATMSGSPQLDLGFESGRKITTADLITPMPTTTITSPRPKKKWGKKKGKTGKSAKRKTGKSAKGKRSGKTKKGRNKGRQGRDAEDRVHTGYNGHISGNVVQITSRDFEGNDEGIYGFKIFELELMFQPTCVDDPEYLPGPIFDTECNLKSNNFCENCAHQCSATQHCVNEVLSDAPGVESFGAYSCVCAPGYADNGLPRLGLLNLP